MVEAPELCATTATLGAALFLSMELRICHRALFAFGLLALAQALPTSAEANYLFNVRILPWFGSLSGTVSDDNSLGVGSDVDLDTDLGLSDFVFAPGGSANLRLGRHDIFASGFAYDNSTTETVTRTFNFGEVNFAVSTQVASDVQIVTGGLEYGFALFTGNLSGVRLEPTIGVSYFGIDVTLTDQTTGFTDNVDVDVPVPTLGARAEIGLGDFQVEGDIQGLYVNVSDIEAAFVQGDAAVVWRLLANMGVLAGYRFTYTRGEVGGFQFDALFHGPFAGIEFRF